MSIEWEGKLVAASFVAWLPLVENFPGEKPTSAGVESRS